MLHKYWPLLWRESEALRQVSLSALLFLTSNFSVSPSLTGRPLRGDQKGRWESNSYLLSLCSGEADWEPSKMKCELLLSKKAFGLLTVKDAHWLLLVESQFLCQLGLTCPSHLNIQEERLWQCICTLDSGIILFVVSLDRKNRYKGLLRLFFSTYPNPPPMHGAWSGFLFLI